MQIGALTIAVYLSILPFLVALHSAEHHRMFVQADSHQTVVFESISDCDICYLNKHQKFVNRADITTGLVAAYAPFIEDVPISITTVSDNYFYLRAPPKV